MSATLSILESRTCVEATCDQHGAPNSATLTLRVDPVSRKVVAATAPAIPRLGASRVGARGVAWQCG